MLYTAIISLAIILLLVFIFFLLKRRNSRIIKLTNEEAKKLLLEATFKGQVTEMKLMLRKWKPTVAEINNFSDGAGRSLMCISARIGCLQGLEVLHKYGARVDCTDRRGDAPIIHGARNGLLKCVAFLITHGADPNQRGHNQWTSLHWAALNGHHEVAKYLLKHGAKVNICDNRGTTAAHYASITSHPQTLAILTEYGADLNIRDINGETPLHFAAKHASRCIELLLHHNVKIFTNHKGETPFDIALYKGHGPTSLRLFKYEITYQQEDDNIEPKTSSERRHELLERLIHKLITVNSVKEVENIRKIILFFCQHQEQERNSESLNSVENSLFAEILEVICRHLTEISQKLLTLPQIDMSKKTFHILLHTLTNLAFALKSPGTLSAVITPHNNNNNNSNSHSEQSNIKWKWFQIRISQMETMWNMVDCHLQYLEQKSSTLPSSTQTIEFSHRNNNNSSNNNNNRMESDIIVKAGNSIINITSANNVIATEPTNLCKSDVSTQRINVKANGENEMKEIVDRIAPLIAAFYEFSKISPNSSLEERFLHLIDRHQTLIRSLVKLYPELLLGPFEFILENIRRKEWHLRDLVTLLSFEQKCTWFRLKLETTVKIGHLKLKSFTVNRGYSLLQDSCAAIMKASPEELKTRIWVKFHDEMGVGSGVLREWFRLITAEIFNQDNALFKLSSDGMRFQPNSRSDVNPDHLSYFRMAGRIIGLAILNEECLNVHFTRSFYKHILNIKPNLDDLYFIDPEYHKNLKWVLDNDIDEVHLELTFSVVEEVFGKSQVIDLIPHGDQIPVTENNKRDYVQLMTEYLLTKGITEQLNSFVEGLYEIIPSSLLAIFSDAELELLISGLPDIDIDDWMQHTNYSGGYERESPQIVWFWDWVRHLRTEEQALLLQFVTGSTQVPLGGFAHLRGHEGPLWFTITKVPTTTALPTASTCFNLLKLPEYKSQEELCKYMNTALVHGSSGFEFT
jgi:E3 ubiquitin-protein ligase HACE1